MTPTKILHNCTEQALAHPEIASAVRDQFGMVEDTPLPLYPGKSPNHPELDLVQPIVNGCSDIWQSEVLGWERQPTLRFLSGGLIDSNKSFDFARKLSDGRWVVVEWQLGNAGRNGTDISKAEQLHRLGLLGLAIIIRFDHATAKTADSGLATIEQMHKHRAELKDVPVLGIGMSRDNTRVVDLTQLQDITFPGVLGGSGKGSKQVHAYLARAILHDEDMANVRLPEHLRDVVWQYDREHIAAELQRFQTKLDQALACRDSKHRQELLESFATVQRSLQAPASEPRYREPARSRVRRIEVPNESVIAPGTEACDAGVPEALLGATPHPGLQGIFVAPAREAEQPPSEQVFAPRSTPGTRAYRVPRAEARTPSQPPAVHAPAVDWRQKTIRLAQHHSGALAQAFGRALK